MTIADSELHSRRTSVGEAPDHSAAIAEPVLLVIADISGYTRYMTANAKTLAHSQTIITELVKAIIRQIELPLEVAKLEGDAVFLFCRKQNGLKPWPETKKIIGDNLITFFLMFSEKIRELSQSTTCTCNACTHIEQLRLKIVVHSGEALFHRVLNFVELAGVDVIIVHRLLKNSVVADQYLLLTEAAQHDLEFSGDLHLSNSAETYDDIGRIKTLVYLPDGQPEVAPTNTPFTSRFGKSWKLFCKLWFAPYSFPPRLTYVTSDVSKAGRIGFAFLTLMLTPIYLPVGTMFVLFHAWRKRSQLRRHDDGHEHRGDGSCCDGH